MKTKEQILRWLDRQSWKSEFYENNFKYGINNIKYNKDFVITAFSWGATKQGYKYWAQINKEYLKWYNTKDNHSCNMNNLIDKAIIDRAWKFITKHFYPSSIKNNGEVNWGIDGFTEEQFRKFMEE